MNRSSLNNGFGLIGILVLVVAGGAGAYVWHRNDRSSCLARTMATRRPRVTLTGGTG